ncbi:hypothetical protein M9458_053491, partial [Cirrhinus mrigala]
LHLHQFANDRARIAFIISLLAGRALQWADALWRSESPLIYSLSGFVKHFKKVFSQATTEISVHDELLGLRQADLTIHDYTLRFRTLAASSGWNAAFRRARGHLRGLGGLGEFPAKSFPHLSTYNRLPYGVFTHYRCHSRAHSSSTRGYDHGELSRGKQVRRITNGLCLYYGSQDHLLRTCPLHPPCPVVSTVHITPSVSHGPYIDALLTHNCTSFPVKILVDSGASGNFISSHTLQWLHIPSTNNWTIYQIATIQGKPLGKVLVHHCTPEVMLDIGCLHSERILLLVLEEANVDIVLGHPWLTRHDPIINWRSGEIQKWSSRCYQECLKELPKPVITTTHLSVCFTSVEYQAFQDFFSKVAATHLLPH